MSFPVNQNISPSSKLKQQNVAMGLNTPDIDSEKVKQGVSETLDNQNNFITQKAKQDKESHLLKMLFFLPTWFGISQLMEVFNHHCATRTDGKPNILERVRDFGDAIGEEIESAPGAKTASKTGSKIVGGWKKFVSKIPILDAVINNPAKPKNMMARVMIGGTLHETAQDGKELIEAFVKNPDGQTFNKAKLKRLGMTAEEFEKMNKAPYEHIDRIIEICKKVKPGSKEDCIQLANVNTTGMPQFIKRGVKKVAGQKGYEILLGRKIRFSEVVNKLEALKGTKGKYGKTALGKILPKMFLRVTEGLTNGTAGGKIAIAMQASFVAEAIARTIKAEKGEKGKTFIESMINDLSYYMLIPLGMAILYGAGGLKYIGMNEEQVAKYRSKLEAFNKKVENGKFGSRVEYDKAREELKTLLKGNTKLRPKVDGAGKTVWKSFTNIFHKPLKGVGYFLTTGLEPVKKYTGKDASILHKISNGISKLNLINHIPNPMTGKKFNVTAKGFGGAMLRLGLYMFVISPPLVNMIVKGCHKIFGKPKNSILDEGKEEETAKKAGQYSPLIYPNYGAKGAKPLANQAQNQVQNNQSLSGMQPVGQNSNLNYNQAAHKQPKMVPVGEPVKRRYIPSDEGVIAKRQNNLLNIYNSQPQRRIVADVKPEPQTNKVSRGYVPSSEGFTPLNNNSTVDLQKYETQLKKADWAEKSANRFINSGEH